MTDISRLRDAVDQWAYVTGTAPGSPEQYEAARNIVNIVITGGLGPEVLRLRAQIQAMRDWADSLEAEAPKPEAGGFFAEELRARLAAAAKV